MDLNQIRQRIAPYTFANKSYSKVFGIGYNKTGTTSLEAIFKAVGLSVPNQQEQEVRLVRQLHQGNLEPLKSFVGRFDAFQDAPFAHALTFVQVDALFPGSKFILTVRDPEAWFDSMCRFHCKAFGVSSVDELTPGYARDKTLYLYRNYIYDSFVRQSKAVRNNELYEDPGLMYDKDHRIRKFEQRNALVIEYFQQRPDDLLVIDLTRERDTSRILDFLGIPAEFSFAVPHENSNP
jgi:hypothetical protein